MTLVFFYSPLFDMTHVADTSTDTRLHETCIASASFHVPEVFQFIMQYQREELDS